MKVREFYILSSGIFYQNLVRGAIILEFFLPRAYHPEDLRDFSSKTYIITHTPQLLRIA